jgi:phage/plasmid-like protein (TIGR03299 family)
MAHNITVREDGKAEVFVTKVPAWHGLGQVVENSPTSKEAIVQAGLEWGVEKVDLFAYYGETLKQVDGKVGIQRQDNGRVLGVTGVKYQPVQNVETFDLLDTIAGEEGLKYESAGSLNGGSMIWLLAHMPEATFITPDDRNENYILLKSGHDGLTSMEAMLTKVRVVCQNTLNMALRSGKNRIRVKHCLNAKDKIAQAREILLGIKAESNDLDSILRSLSIVGMASNKVTEYLDKMFPLPVVEDKDHPKTKTINIRNQILTNFEYDEEQNTEATKGTAYGLLNATTKWVDHQRNPKNSYNRWESAMFGQGSDLKVEALVQIRKIVGV